MRPLKLRLSGFTCFREPTEISFEDLELFAIAGATGAGKSTLLDAMTYALYGRTARLGSQVGETLFSPGLEQMFVSLEFRTDRERSYRVTRVSERKGSRGPKNETRIERLEPDARWKQLPESERLAEANDKLKGIVGLDYESFTRAVLLPQGAFDQFLRGSSGERTRLLVSLLGLERIRAMQGRAGERARDAKLRENAIRERLEGDYAGVSPERRRDLKGALAELETERDELEGAREALLGRVRGLEEVKALLEAREEVGRRLVELRTQEEGIAETQRALERAREADTLLPYLDEVETRRQRLHEAAARRRALETTLQEAAQALEAASGRLQEAEEAAERIPELTTQLEALAGVQPLVAQLKDRGGSLALAPRADPGVLYSDAAWDALKALEWGLPALKRARQEVSAAQERVGAAQRGQAAATQQVGTLEEEVARIKGAGKAARELLNEAESAYREAEVQDRAAALRPHLHLGAPCPVCEQPVRQLPAAASVDVAALERRRDEAKNRLEELLEGYAQVNSRLATARARAEDRRAEVAQAEAALARQQGALADLEGPYGEADPTAIEARLKMQRTTLLAGLAKSIMDKAHGLDPERAQADLSRTRRGLQEGLKGAQERFWAAQRKLDGLRADEKGLAARVAELSDEFERVAETFGERLARAAFESAQAVREAALPAPRQEALAAHLESYARDLERAEREDVDLEDRLAGRTLEAGAYEAARAQKDEFERRLAELQRRLGELTGELRRLETQLDKARELREAATKLREVMSTYTVLARDLQSNGFPAYMLGRVQHELATRASDILGNVTEGRYELLFEGDEYSVLDAWSGERRSAKTLSGGESFITSLALALALSDTLAGNTSLGALFLDEGFGTLDAETLESVTGVLESLTANGRMVGVITHVAALTARLPARLWVHKGPDGSVTGWD